MSFFQHALDLSAQAVKLSGFLLDLGLHPLGLDVGQERGHDKYGDCHIDEDTRQKLERAVL